MAGDCFQGAASDARTATIVLCWWPSRTVQYTFLASIHLTAHGTGLSPASRYFLMGYLDMIRHKRSQGRLLPSVNNAPPAPAAIDIEIADHNGSTVAIEATPDRVQAAKKMPTPSLLADGRAADLAERAAQVGDRLSPEETRG